MKEKKIIATGRVNLEGLTIPVNVHKIRNEYGRVRFTISPTVGTGEIKREGVVLDADYKDLLNLL